MTDPAPNEEALKAKVVYDESLRAVAEQRDALKQFRARSTVVASVANGAAALLALNMRVSTSGGDAAAATFWIGVAGLLAVVVSVVLIQWPVKLKVGPMGFGKVRSAEPTETSSTQAGVDVKTVAPRFPPWLVWPWKPIAAFFVGPPELPVGTTSGAAGRFRGAEGKRRDYAYMLWNYAEINHRNVALNARRIWWKSVFSATGLVGSVILIGAWTLNALVFADPASPDPTQIQLVETK